MNLWNKGKTLVASATTSTGNTSATGTERNAVPSEADGDSSTEMELGARLEHVLIEKEMLQAEITRYTTSLAECQAIIVWRWS